MPDKSGSSVTSFPHSEAMAAIRHLGPYKIPPDSSKSDSETLWLTPVEMSDSPELFRIMNLSPAISLGLYSSNVVFPFPVESAQHFVKRHVQNRTTRGVNYSFAIRVGTPGRDSPMVGLVALDEHDHEHEGLCIRNPITNDIENLISHPLTSGDDSMEQPSEEGPTHFPPQASQEENEARQRARAAAEGKQVLSCGGFGYWISDEHAGKGYMTRVVRYVLDHLCQEFGYHRFHADGWEDNLGTLRVMAKAGMTYNTTRTIYVPKFQANKQCVEYIWDING
ncbi:hypothetical protein BGW41_005197 [Actinomortierella wolfii]|nr:hypothetical protein BGW41_005197 [Actinomortierella wolfii]